MCERRNILCGCTCTDGHTGERRAVDLLVFEVRHLTFPVATLKHEVFLPLRQMATPRWAWCCPRFLPVKKRSFSFPLLPSACWLVGVIVGLYLTVWSTLLWFGAKWINLILNWCHRKCPFCSEWKLTFRPLLCIIDQFESWKVLIDAVLQAFQSEVTENGMIGRWMVCCRKSWEAPPPLQTSQMKRASPRPILFLFCVNLKRCAVSSVPSPCFCGRLFWTDITGDDIIRKQEFCCVQTHVSCLIWLPQLWSMSVGLCICEPRKCAPLPVCAENATGIMRGIQTSSSGKNNNRRGSENSGFP